MNNYLGDGQTPKMVAPSALTAGVPVVIGGIFAIPRVDVDSGDEFAALTRCEVRLTKATGFAPSAGDVAYWDIADAALNSDTANVPCGHYVEAALTGDTTARVRLLDTPVASVSSLTTRATALERQYGFTGAGDTATMSDTAEHVFTSKATVPASAFVVEDWIEWECEILISGAVSTPAVTCKLYLGTAVLDSQAIATAAANDGVVIRGRGRITGATTMRAYKGLGYTKDATVTYQTPIAPADLTIQSLGTARDVTASVTSDAGNGGNTAVIKSLRIRASSYAT